MLVWIEKPNEKECRKVGVGSKKFYCGRKKKYGLNLQASCDHLKRFTSVSIIYPASTSDFLAFETSRFHTEIKQEGGLHTNLIKITMSKERLFMSICRNTSRC